MRRKRPEFEIIFPDWVYNRPGGPRRPWCWRRWWQTWGWFTIFMVLMVAGIIWIKFAA